MPPYTYCRGRKVINQPTRKAASKVFGRTIPVVEDISEAALDSMDDASRNTVSVNPVAAESWTTDQKTDKKSQGKSKKLKKGQKKGISHDTSKPKGRTRDSWGSKRMSAEEETTENDDASKETESFDSEFVEQPAVSGTPAQQLWRECVRDAKGDMDLAKQLRDDRSL